MKKEINLLDCTFRDGGYYNNWNFNKKNYHLIKYVLPNEDIEDYNIIKKNINNIENYNFKEITKKYNLNHEIILIILKS